MAIYEVRTIKRCKNVIGNERDANNIILNLTIIHPAPIKDAEFFGESSGKCEISE
jgi:hypothetical protein